LVNEYFQQESFFSTSSDLIGIIDVGWNGRIQKSIENISQKAKIDPFNIHGYYIGINRNQKNISSTKLSGYVFDKSSKAKLQATGYDSKGRKQYIYNKDYVERNKKNKFTKISTFDYSKYCRILRHYISYNNLSRNCVIANVIKLMEDLNIRVGNESYKKENGTFGISTLFGLTKEELLYDIEESRSSSSSSSSIISRPLSPPAATYPPVEIVIFRIPLSKDSRFSGISFRMPLCIKFLRIATMA
jgi:hypothetical protein